MARKATIGFMIVTMVAFFILAGMWAVVRLERVRSGPATEELTLDQIVRNSQREEFWFNAMFVAGNLSLVSLAHFGALRHRRRMTSKRTNP